MTLIRDYIKWIMLISGTITCTMIYVVISPQAALLSTFGETLAGPLAELVVRSWGMLIVLMGAMLILAAFRPVYRTLVLFIVGLGKLFFIALVLMYGYGQQAMVTVLFDGAVVLICFVYLLSIRDRTNV